MEKQRRNQKQASKVNLGTVSVATHLGLTPTRHLFVTNKKSVDTMAELADAQLQAPHRKIEESLALSI